jgi:hypothetical protein
VKTFGDNLERIAGSFQIDNPAGFCYTNLKSNAMRQEFSWFLEIIEPSNNKTVLY